MESRFAWPEEGCRRTLDGSACTCKEMSLKSETHLMTNEVLYINGKFWTTDVYHSRLCV